MSVPATGEHARAKRRRRGLPRAFQDSEFRVALVVAVCLLGEAVVAKNVLDVQLDVISQLGAMWVWLVYSLSGRRDRAGEIEAMAGAVLVTAAILVLYAL